MEHTALRSFESAGFHGHLFEDFRVSALPRGNPGLLACIALPVVGEPPTAGGVVYLLPGTSAFARTTQPA
eukprot:CAMPEP_0171636648 /NCGR_PEP_ID=MMETSP0990-20121206/27564_1 /TAXON_ID=483369 /ORGANISM="non described non described, Strain CCMP2098" /LENGTH=69 /DNA_ID=CAMNT_0012208877 /DNA_START=89 /DNA_END=294 /DNA_ORIENTATION=-